MTNFRKQALQTSLGALLACCAIGAHAGTTTLTSYTFGSNNVNATTPSGGYAGGAGGFSGTLSGFGASWDTASLRTYCVELNEFFSFGTPYTSYNIVEASSYYGFDATKVARLGKLFTYAFDGVGNDVDTAAESTALQLAVWNIRYDSDLTVGSGLFKDISSFAAQADTYLSQSQLLAAANQDLYVLQSGPPGQQDQIIWRQTPQGENSNTDVPEPASLALVGIALLGVVASRRRKSV